MMAGAPGALGSLVIFSSSGEPAESSPPKRDRSQGGNEHEKQRHEDWEGDDEVAWRYSPVEVLGTAGAAGLKGESRGRGSCRERAITDL